MRREGLFGFVGFVGGRILMGRFILFRPILSLPSRRIVEFYLYVVATKIVPPIVLFLVDVSGSMMASVSTNIWNKK